MLQELGVAGLNVTEEISALVDSSPDKRVAMSLRGGWNLAISRSIEGLEIEHYQPNETGVRKFFVYSTIGNPYGAGKTFQEPDLAVSVGVYDKTYSMVGALVIDDNNRVIQRFSWSNLYFIQKRGFAFNQNKLSLRVVSSEDPNRWDSHGYLKMLFSFDKNRITGYVGVFGPTKPRPTDFVKVFDMEQLILASL